MMRNKSVRFHSASAWSLGLIVAIAVVCISAKPARSEDDPRKAQPRPPQVAEELTEEEYYELLRLLADTMDQVERNYVKEVSRRELVEAAIEGVISKLDQYSNYIPPEDLDRFRSGVENEFGGIGIQVAIQNGWLTITSPIVGTPAYRAGLMAGDVIIKIEGESTKGITLDEAVKKLKGKVGTSVTFTVRHPHADDEEAKEETVKVKREIVRVDSVLGDTRLDDDSWNWYLDEEKKIAYIRLTSFSRRTAEDLRTAMRKLESSSMRGLVLDLRFNPGGLLSSAVEVADMFVSEGVIVSTKGRNTPEKPRRAHKTGTYEGFPMAVLVNRYSASASEIVSACLQDHERAIVVGERSWGKGSVQNIINMESGRSALKLTTASYHRPSGLNIHRFDGASESDVWGVQPSEGFRVRLTDDEMGDLLDYRRKRDVVRGAEDETESDFVDKQLKKAVRYVLSELRETSDDPREAEPRPPRV